MPELFRARISDFILSFYELQPASAVLSRHVPDVGYTEVIQKTAFEEV